MKTTGLLCRMPMAVLLAVGMTATVCFSQGTAPAAQGPAPVVLRKITGLTGNDWRKKTPNIGANSSSKAREWGVFDVEFDVVPEWIDEMTVTYTIMLQAPKGSTLRQEFSLLKLTSRYTDIEKNKGRMVSAVLLPSAIQRYGVPVGIVAEFTVNDKVVGLKSEEIGLLKGKVRWWEDRNVIDSTAVAKREGLLVNRAQTPFWLVRLDDYEVNK